MSTIKKTEAQVSATVEGETVVLQLASGTYFSLNEVGDLVWKLLDQPRRVEELCASIVAEYEVDEEQCHADVRALLDEMKKAGLIEVS